MAARSQTAAAPASAKRRGILCVLFVFQTTLLFGLLLLLIFLYQHGYYNANNPPMVSSVYTKLIEKDCRTAAEFAFLPHEGQQLPPQLDPAQTNFRFLATVGEDPKKWPGTWKDGNTYIHTFTYDAGRQVIGFLDNHIEQPGKPNDVYRYAARVFASLRALRYWAPLLFLAALVLEAVLTVGVCLPMGRQDAHGQILSRPIDQVPMYMFGAFCVLFLLMDISWVGERFRYLTDLSRLLPAMQTRAAQSSAAYLYGSVEWTQFALLFASLFVSAYILYLFLTTTTLRLKTPDWWRQTMLYRLFVMGNMEQRTRALLWAVTLLEFALLIGFFVLFRQIRLEHWLLPWGYILLDLTFVLVEVLYIYIVGRGMAYLTHRTHRIARDKKGSISVQALQDQSRVHADNINILSRNANAQMEQRFINESFSIRLINNVSRGLRGPLRAVSENVRLLESGELSAQAQQESVRRIGDLSQDLKKTIEDLIRVSRASTGVIETDPVPTDAVEMLHQAVGEYYEQFEDKQIQPQIEVPPLPLMIRADGEFMWNIFDGILSAIVGDGVPGTRAFFSAKQTGEHVLVLFRGTVQPPEEDDESADSGLGLPFAKVYAELQGGDVYYKYGRDTLTVALRFPTILSVQEV